MIYYVLFIVYYLLFIIHMMKQQRADRVIGDTIIGRFLVRNIDDDHGHDDPIEAPSVSKDSWNRFPRLKGEMTSSHTSRRSFFRVPVCIQLIQDLRSLPRDERICRDCRYCRNTPRMHVCRELGSEADIAPISCNDPVMMWKPELRTLDVWEGCPQIQSSPDAPRERTFDLRRAKLSRGLLFVTV